MPIRRPEALVLAFTLTFVASTVQDPPPGPEVYKGRRKGSGQIVALKFITKR